VIAPARTGSDNNSRAVMVTDHTNSGIHSSFMLFGFILIVVVMKFTAPRIDDTPAKWLGLLVLRCVQFLWLGIDCSSCSYTTFNCTTC
jgi:hypothetical protein